MKTIQTHASFYVELSPDEIRVCPKHGVISVYPIWLGKNRAIMRDALNAFKKNPPKTHLECIELTSRLGLAGMGGHGDKIEELFVEEKNVDKNQIFW